MITRLRFIVLVLFATAIASPGCTQKKPLTAALPATQPTTTQPAWGELAEGLRIGLSVDRATYRPGDDITFTVSLVNASDKKLACVLPSNDKDSDFPFLIEFGIKRLVHQPERDVTSGGGLRPKRTKVLRTTNPGANEYKLAPKGQVYSAGFEFNTIAIASGTSGGEYGDYEVRVGYFIRGSTPAYGPAQDEKLRGAELWAGRYAYSGPVKFTVLADLPGGGLSIAQAVGGEGFGMAVAGKGDIPGENPRGQWGNGGFQVSQPLSKAARPGEGLAVHYSVSRMERPIFKNEPVILILHRFDEEYDPRKVIKIVADTVENRAAIAKAVAALKDDGAWREATMARYQEKLRLREPIKMPAQTQPEGPPAAESGWTLKSMPEIVIRTSQLFNGFGFVNLDKAEVVPRPANAPRDFKQREAVTGSAYTADNEWVLGSDPIWAADSATGKREQTFTAREVTAEWWDKVSPSQVRAQTNGPLMLSIIESKAGTPRVYLFRTIAGTRGLIRLAAPAGDTRDEFHITIKLLMKDGEQAPATQPATHPRS
jgi:hypothetical protein